jgi:PEP-CTERM motif-containing protein
MWGSLFGTESATSVTLDFGVPPTAAFDVGLDNVQVTPTGANVPEPAALLLLGIGLAGVGFARTRQRK